MPYHTATIDRFGIEIELDVDFDIAYHGCPSNGWDEPGEAPEININRMTTVEAGIKLDINKDISQTEYEEIETAICEDIAAGEYD